ncbi:MAG: RDD family protein [Cytophagaceae bacterium]|nr:RDD family protein [Cytophagaceae bacterium]
MEGLLVETTQNVTLEYQPASIGERILATLVDSVIKGAWLIFWFMVLGLSGRFNRTLFDSGATILLFIVVLMPVILYGLLSEILLNGQTVGKRTLGIRVVRLDGNQPTLSAYLLRWLFRPFEITLFYGVVAIVTIVVNGRGQRLGDILAKTAVVKIRPPVLFEDVVALPTADDNYRVTFPEVAALTDRDAATLRAALNKGLTEGNPELIEAAAQKVKDVMGIQSDLDAVHFLQIALRDHTQIALRERN